MVDISNLLDKAKAWHNCELCNISCRKKAFARGDDLMPIKYLFIGIVISTCNYGKEELRVYPS